jgi:hypothetical protein
MCICSALQGTLWMYRVKEAEVTAFVAGTRFRPPAELEKYPAECLAQIVLYA